VNPELAHGGFSKEFMAGRVRGERGYERRQQKSESHQRRNVIA
jgi:hypothetical protein